jgi:hypothetical protein
MAAILGVLRGDEAEADGAESEPIPPVVLDQLAEAPAMDSMAIEDDVAEVPTEAR